MVEQKAVLQRKVDVFNDRKRERDAEKQRRKEAREAREAREAAASDKS